VPVAEINLLDEYRQFTKSPQQDGQSPNTPREDSFCDVTIQTPGILVVLDAAKDARFSGKTTVTGDRHIRFYAGYALQSAGHQVGTLCIVDTVPRGFTADDHITLERLGRWVESELYKYATVPGRRPS
jgi:sigma-B regulation protein RsbU (phosphoserine phosphatase)